MERPWTQDSLVKAMRNAVMKGLAFYITRLKAFNIQLMNLQAGNLICGMSCLLDQEVSAQICAWLPSLKTPSEKYGASRNQRVFSNVSV